MLTLLGITQMAAQEYEYVPFVREGVKWVCYYYNFRNAYPYDEYFKPGKTYFTLELKGDVEINGIVYKAMHKYSGDAIDPENDTVLICLREQDKVVYGIVPDGKKYPDFFIGYGIDLNSEINAGNEFVLYDFNNTDTWCQWIYRRNPDRIESVESDLIDLGGKPATRHTYIMNELYRIPMYFIEGIGVDGYYSCYPLAFFNYANYYCYPYYLSHVVEEGKTIYKGVNYEYVAPLDGRVPVAREGIQWVNEKVVINHGDTTRYYYTYELKGDDEEANQLHKWKIYKYCHYYTGDKIDPDNDSIICSMAEEPSFCVTYVVNNRAMEKVEQEGRNILQRVYMSPDSTCLQLYYFDHDNPSDVYLQYSGWQNWREMERPFFINKNTFFEVEPVEIDGHECRRYAFVDEEGIVQAYVVEGIGFDSRDMGDLLTQFTRKPDPDADYQEYCGLSHVIKDGKIIYKGLRYRPDQPGDVNGDVNCDGEVTIADANNVVDIVVMGGNSGHTRSPAADVNGDGEINIADINAIINIIISNNQQ